MSTPPTPDSAGYPVRGYYPPVSHDRWPATAPLHDDTAYASSPRPLVVAPNRVPVIVGSWAVVVLSLVLLIWMLWDRAQRVTVMSYPVWANPPG